MKRSALFASVIAVAVLSPLPQARAAFHTPDVPHGSSVASAGVTVKVPESVVEGERFKVRVRLTRTAEAKRITLERQYVDVFDDKSWETVKSVAAEAQAMHVFKTIADESSTGRFRARVTYRDGNRSRPSPLAPRCGVGRRSTPSARTTARPACGPPEPRSFAMNGTEYKGWTTYATAPTWEERFTVGRHCKELRGDFGVEDDSDDGTSAITAIVADDVPVFTSGSLTPGMVQRASINLDRPYRLAIRATNTSPSDLEVFPGRRSARAPVHGHLTTGIPATH